MDNTPTKEQGDQPQPSPISDLAHQVEAALACPCIADLKEGPCGQAFVQAFKCFLESKSTEQGSDCIEPFMAMQQCLMAHPEEFAAFVMSKEESDEEHDQTSEEEEHALSRQR